MRIILFFLLILLSCKETELKIKSIELCEFFSNEGICKEKLEAVHEYNLTINKNKTFENWEALSNYLYFHSRQTPGFIVRFNRKFTVIEMQKLKSSYKANYEFYGSSGIVEGFEIGEDWVGSFQYLGSILKDRQRKFKENKNFPYLESVFPSSIKFKFFSDYAEGKIETEINLKFTKKEE
jgi:hypothetical protein